MFCMTRFKMPLYILSFLYQQVEEELWEQAFIEACFEDMLAEEEIHWYFSQLPALPFPNGVNNPWDVSYDSPLPQQCLDYKIDEVSF